MEKKSLVVLNECMFTAKQISLLKKNFSNVRIYNDTVNEDQAINRIRNRQIVILDQFMFTFSEKIFLKCPNIELLIINTTAYDRIDVSLLNKYKVKLINLRAYATYDVAETALAFMFSLNMSLDLARKIVVKHKLDIPGYKYNREINDIEPGNLIIPYIERKQIRHQTVGIVGLGKIGLELAYLCLSLGMKVVAYNRTRKEIPDIKMLSLEDLFSSVDIIVLTLAYDKKTMRGMISRDLLDKARQGSVLISMSPSEIIDIDALIELNFKFKGIGFDYLVTNKVRGLLKLKRENIIVTPHLGGQSYEAYNNLATSIIESAIAYIEGKTIYTVN